MAAALTCRRLPQWLSGVHSQSDSGLPDTNGLALVGEEMLALWEAINCVHGFLIGGASLYVDRILWLATYTSSSFSSFLVQLFRVVLMKLNYESENSKLKSYESKDRESESYKSESHDSQGTSIHFFSFFHQIMLSRWRKRSFSQRGAHASARTVSGRTLVAQAFLWELTEGSCLLCVAVF